MTTFIYFVFYIFFCVLTIIFMKVIKKKQIANVILFIMALSIFNNGIIWINETHKKVDKSLDKWGKRIDSIEEKFNGVGEKIDQANDTVEKVKETKEKIENNNAVKGLNKGLNKVDEIDKKIKDFGFGIREKITGEKVKREE